MNNWDDLWRRVISKTVQPITDVSAFFKNEYETVARDVRGQVIGRLQEADDGGYRFLRDRARSAGPQHGSLGEGRLRVAGTAQHHDLNTVLARYAYQDDDGWTGGDSTYIRQLPDGRHVIMFSDTFLGRVRPDGSRVQATPFVSNSFVVVNPDGTMRTHVTRTDNDRVHAVVPPEDRQFHWLGGSHVTRGNTLDVMFLRFSGDPRVADTGRGYDDARFQAGFTPEGNREAEFLKLQENTLVRFDTRDLSRLDSTPMPSETGVHWASWVEFDERGNHTYVYGVDDQGADKFMHVARVSGDDLRQPWEFNDGSGGWSPRETDSAPLMSGIANEYSVSRFNDDKFLLVTQDTNTPYSPDIMGYIADSPAGPFTSPTRLYSATESGPFGFYGDPNAVVYNAHEQPDLRRGNELTITYNLNSSVQDVLDTTSKYRPNAVKVRLDLLD